ncbi:MAG: ATP-binding cassette domain-containing protein [Gammaproteobacteria bacterium]|nr:ATP-binding cassette domain-containing protein [Gammaproteobacteria bacterium]
MRPVIHTKDLGRIYKIRGGKKEDPKELVALDHVNMTIQSGELFGLLGPNGAGKTTLIKILTTLLAPTSGEAHVAGFNVSTDPGEVRPRINMVSGGETSGYGLLTVRENLWMFAQFYGIDSKVANQRIKDLLEIVGLGDRINTKSSDLSTGLRQKMNIVRGFLTDPEVLFLDEPTLGLDVGASRDVRDFIRTWVNDNPEKTILLTTHYMVEADELCDRVAIINEGKVLACDKPSRLKRELQKDSIFRIESSPMNGVTIEDFRSIPGVREFTSEELDGHNVLEFILQEESVLGSVINKMTSNNIQIINLEKREPTLEDVFVSLTGKRLEEGAPADE